MPGTFSTQRLVARPQLVLQPAKVRVDLVARYTTRPDSARDRSQLAVSNQCANLVLGAAQLDGELTNR